MPTYVEALPGEPILIVHSEMSTDDLMKSTQESIAIITEALDQQTEPVFLISDVREITMSLEDIIQVMSAIARGQNPMVRHPNIRDYVTVLAADRLIRMATKGLESATFGKISVHMFDTLEDALAYCRRQIAGGAS